MQRKALYALCATIFPLMVCSGMVYSVLPLYISGQLNASTTQIGFIYMVGAATGAIFAPSLGRLSDKIGRRKVMLFCMGGFAIAFALYGVIRNVPQVFPIQALEGLSWAAMGTAVPALIADMMPPEDRGWAMGMYERTWSVGWIVGPLLGGFLAQTLGFRVTFIIGAALVAIAVAVLAIKPIAVSHT